MNTIPLDEAIARARQWRADASCSPAAAVAIALLERLEVDMPDAARYRQLRDFGVPALCVYINGAPSYLGASHRDPDGPRLDAAVDAAITAGDRA